MDPACLGFRVQMDLGCLRLGFRIWGFPKIRGTILGNFGEPYNKDYSNLVCILGPFISGNYHLGFRWASVWDERLGIE